MNAKSLLNRTERVLQHIHIIRFHCRRCLVYVDLHISHPIHRIVIPIIPKRAPNWRCEWPAEPFVILAPSTGENETEEVYMVESNLVIDFLSDRALRIQ